ncbi:uncharacterized protein LOC110634831 [Hevea brasiliensis]|uniref:uncharacterized protein LOC110634831 n=1 Tax=Hevea brasiliensis TaxID=3981 RepID=UPI0025FEA0F6|nr:uncharacterized protein LOC110634831 [Hevea brasiliensis]
MERMFEVHPKTTGEILTHANRCGWEERSRESCLRSPAHSMISRDSPSLLAPSRNLTEVLARLTVRSRGLQHRCSQRTVLRRESGEGALLTVLSYWQYAIRLEEEEKDEEMLQQMTEEAEEYKGEFYRKRQLTIKKNKASNTEKERDKYVYSILSFLLDTNLI